MNTIHAALQPSRQKYPTIMSYDVMKKLRCWNWNHLLATLHFNSKGCWESNDWSNWKKTMLSVSEYQVNHHEK